MIGLRYTLLSDGSSDQILTHAIRWAIRRKNVRIEQESFADLSRARPRPRSLVDRAKQALELFPCDVLFLHRDAEKEPLESRLKEVQDALRALDGAHVPVIPVRMTEAWFLHDEEAIRRASGNPAGKTELHLPRIQDLESLNDPKTALSDALLTASEMSGRHRRRRKRKLSRMRRRVAELIHDFGPLTQLEAFQRFCQDLDTALESLAIPEAYDPTRPKGPSVERSDA